MENSWQYLLLRTDILQKQSFGVPRKLVRLGVRSHGTTLTVWKFRLLSVQVPRCEQSENFEGFRVNREVSAQIFQPPCKRRSLRTNLLQFRHRDLVS